MTSSSRPSVGAARHAVGLGLALGSMGLVASLLPLTLMLEEALGLGALFSARGAVAPPADVVVIGISRESAQALGQTSELDTWPRELHAQLVERLTAAGVTVIAFDLMFHEPREGPGDALLAASIERAGSVLLLEETGDSDVALARRRIDGLARTANAAARVFEGGARSARRRSSCRPFRCA